MTFYQQEIARIKEMHYSNQRHLKAVIETRHYIADNFDEALNLGLLAQARFVSKFHLLRLFKKYYGVTPKQYLTNKRMEKALELLKAGRGVTETCFEIGWDSPCSFSTLFKSRTGLSPAEFQKRATFAKSGSH